MTKTDKQEAGTFAIRFWWTTLLRGLIALALGISLILQPEQAKATLIRYMSLYWLMSGLISLIWGSTRAKVKELWLATGLAEVIGGALILLDPWFDFFETPTQQIMFALVALTTGTLHVIVSILILRRRGRGWSLGNFLMGILQIVLGLYIMTNPSEIHPYAYYGASAWAIIAGVGFVSVALRLREAGKNV